MDVVEKETKMKTFLPFAMASALLFAQGCKCERPSSDEDRAADSSDQAADGMEGADEAAMEAEQEGSEGASSEAVTELQIVDITEGDGDEASSGMSVTVHYKGKLIDGAQFDSSYDRGQPFTFNLGAGQVIKGWDQGVKGMKVGGKRKLIIPAHLGYGDRGAGNLIPPNSTLEFEVELLSVNAK